jgi:nitroreductase
MEILEKLQWRYATKRMNGTKVPTDKLENILKAIQLAPTSMGVQPFKVFVIENKEVLNTIHQGACQQPQVLESSALLVFAVRESLTDVEIDEYMNRTAAERNIPVSSLGDFRKMVSSVKGLSIADYTAWAAKQAYIALGIGLVAAATIHVDATPMEGFSPQAMDEVLNLKEKGLKSVVLLAIGYRDADNDHLAKAAKVRKPQELLFEFIR